MSRERVVIFDLLRIIGIALVVFTHIAFTVGWGEWTNEFWIGNLFYWGVGSIGVLLFLFASGAVLELTQSEVSNARSYLEFVYRRLVRLYPAVWLSVAFAIVLWLNSLMLLVTTGFSAPINMMILNAGFSAPIDMTVLLWSLSGFSAFVGLWGGPFNVVVWCIGLFVVLYLVFPLLHYGFKHKPYLTLGVLFIISLLSTYFINVWQSGLPDLPFGKNVARWMPLCNIFYFGLGIFMARKGWYPKWTQSKGVMPWLGELSFYVFLFHFPLESLSKISILLFAVSTIFTAYLFMELDKKIQVQLKLENVKHTLSEAHKWVNAYLSKTTN
ncbi:MAG: acyltransferase family protein [Candidatus Micrarchaeota archaeon]